MPGEMDHTIVTQEEEEGEEEDKEVLEWHHFYFPSFKFPFCLQKGKRKIEKSLLLPPQKKISQEERSPQAVLSA